jgi:hypothetical protein
MMPREWDHYESKIATHYLCALINDDTSSMEDYEVRDFNTWKQTMEAQARVDGWTVDHWTTDHEDDIEDWGECAVTHLKAMRATVKLMVYKETA